MATATRTKRVKPPLKWHGGKHYLAKKIIEQFPPHIHYVEPYFGGGAVLLQKPAEWIEDHSEVVNDIDGELMNFWKVIGSSDWCSKLKSQLELQPFAKDSFTHLCNPELRPHLTPVDRAHAFFVRYRQSRQGLGKDFATLSRNRTRGGMNEQVSSWLSAIEDLPAAHERLKRVVILNEDALKVIKSQDGPNTLFYLDPPYLHETRGGKKSNDDYEFEMDEEQHMSLLQVLEDINGKFILSGYHSALYQCFQECHYDWRRVDIEIDNKASSKKVKDKKTECLWMNF